MEKAAFISAIKDGLEIESIELTEDTILKEIPEYDSLGVMSLVAIIDEHFGKTYKASDLEKLTTIGSLIELIGTEKFS